MLQVATCLSHKHPRMSVVEMCAHELLTGYVGAIGTGTHLLATQTSQISELHAE